MTSATIFIIKKLFFKDIIEIMKIYIYIIILVHFLNIEKTEHLCLLHFYNQRHFWKQRQIHLIKNIGYTTTITL